MNGMRCRGRTYFVIRYRIQSKLCNPILIMSPALTSLGLLSLLEGDLAQFGDWGWRWVGGVGVAQETFASRYIDNRYLSAGAIEVDAEGCAGGG